MRLRTLLWSYLSPLVVMFALLAGILLLPAASGRAAHPAQVDSIPPVLSVTDIYVKTTNSSGSTVNYRSLVTVSDNSDPNPSLECAPPWGSFFAIGKTIVTCTATDAAGNSRQASFRVLVGIGNDTDLAVRSITFSPRPPLAGRIVTLAVEIANGELSATSGANLAIDLPPEGRLLTAAAGCNLSALPLVTCPLNDLMVRQNRSFSFVIDLDPDASGTMTISAKVTTAAGQRDIDPDNDELSVATPITDPASLGSLVQYLPLIID